MNKYELMYVTKSDATEEKRTQLLEKFKGIIQADGQIDNIDEWGNRRLAYEINKVNEGHYVLVHFNAGADVPKELDRNLKIADEVIRHLILRIEA